MGIHGKPDWGLQVKSTVYTFDDLSELAVRLGSISQFDRRGDVVLLDDFGGGLVKWHGWGYGTGNKQTIQTDEVRSGGYALYLVGGSTSTNMAAIKTYLPYPVLSKWGFEVHIRFPLQFDYIEIELIMEDETEARRMGIKYDRTNQKLQYLNSLGVYQDIETSFRLSSEEPLFHVFKLVADFETKKYHRLIVNEETYDLSAYDLGSMVEVGDKFIEPRILFYSREGYNDYVYIDNIIITQNEP